MASLYKRKSTGKWIIDIYFPEKGRLQVGPDKAVAEAIYKKINRLERCAKFGIPPDPDLISWFETLKRRIQKRLVDLGLLDRPLGLSIADLCRRFEATKIKLHGPYKYGIENLKAFFDHDTLSLVTPHDAKAFRSWLSKKGLAEATIARRFKAAREIFAMAVGEKLIAENPFDGIKAGSQHNAKRSFYVDPELTKKVFAAVSEVEARLAIALGRWAGMRCCEIAPLQWSDVHFEKGILRIDSPKTGLRFCPIFPELRPYLEAGKGDSPFCCPSLPGLKEPRAWIIHRLGKACEAIDGVDIWPKPLQNLRATRATEVSAAFGPKAESEWIGHGEDVAMRHYLMVPDDVLRRAIEGK